MPVGSSPLARGLHALEPMNVYHIGIIPARAGFTFCLGFRNPLGTDHPRSRGVYGSIMNSAHALIGSSPLARGLRAPGLLLVLGARIIPARAGFTILVRNSVTRPRDHPRSRGVYRVFESDSVTTAGSSPLARGLPAVLPEADGGRRIIPARAGFTLTSPPIRCLLSDHPRSRGVYAAVLLACWSYGGSSPLARGLPAVRARGRRVSRIIPARAGFTTSRAWPRAPSEDHPRSRGVYFLSVSQRRVIAGSSPLARGLQVAQNTDLRLERIIPARAGFTYSDDDNDGEKKDHPRSRGVYTIWRTNWTWKAGSSPLARGLQPDP